jgi:amino-acid N-acetyltransferase
MANTETTDERRRVTMGADVRIRRAADADLASLLELLTASGLPSAGVEDWLAQFIVAEHGGSLVGAAGVETYADGALLRSVAVAPSWQGRGLGRALVDAALTGSSALRRDVYLLTTTAETWFPRFGFERIARDDVPASVRQSIEFREACPASAAVLVRRSPVSGATHA